MGSSLQQFLSSHLVLYEDEVLAGFVDAIKKSYPHSIEAIVFYGSCMRTRRYENAVLDFYVVVDNYRLTYQKFFHSFLNKLLPPNVYFLQTRVKDKLYSAKYAVVSYADLARRVSAKAFHPYFWARFCQPIGLAYVKEKETRDKIANCQARSIYTLKHAVDCLSLDDKTSGFFWIRSFQLTYATELRAESPERARSIYKENSEYYDNVLNILTVKCNGIQGRKPSRTYCQLQWKLRNLLGKVLSILRLLKATVTFANGIDYIAWKIRRHTGEEINITNRLRKYPWLFCWPLLWRLLRKGSVR